MASVLVTGAGGFIGSHVVELLVQEGYDVRAFLRYNSRSARGNLDELPTDVQDAVEVFWGDVRDADSVERALDGCEFVLHLAAQIAIPYSYVNPTDFVKTNVLGTANVLNAALRATQIERVVVTSTSETYGSAQYFPMDEGHPLRAQSPYAASKVGADQLAASYYRSFDLPVGILRPFNTYGPRQSLRAIVPTIIAQLLASDEVRLGSLDPRRDLTFVRDTARGFLCMMTAGDVEFGEPVNLGHGEDISIGELYDKLVTLTGSSATLRTDDQRVRPEKSEVNRLCAGTERAREQLGWEPEYSLEDGLLATIDYVRDKLDDLRASTYHI